MRAIALLIPVRLVREVQIISAPVALHPIIFTKENAFRYVIQDIGQIRMRIVNLAGQVLQEIPTVAKRVVEEELQIVSLVIQATSCIQIQVESAWIHVPYISGVMLHQKNVCHVIVVPQDQNTHAILAMEAHLAIAYPANLDISSIIKSA